MLKWQPITGLPTTVYNAVPCATGAMLCIGSVELTHLASLKLSMAQPSSPILHSLVLCIWLFETFHVMQASSSYSFTKHLLLLLCFKLHLPNNVQQLFMCLSAIYVSFCEGSNWPHLRIIFLLFSCNIFIYSRYKSFVRIMHWWYFLLVHNWFLIVFIFERFYSF